MEGIQRPRQAAASAQTIRPMEALRTFCPVAHGEEVFELLVVEVDDLPPRIEIGEAALGLIGQRKAAPDARVRTDVDDGRAIRPKLHRKTQHGCMLLDAEHAEPESAIEGTRNAAPVGSLAESDDVIRNGGKVRLERVTIL